MLRTHVTYANVMATVAVFLALGGVSYAATQLPKNSVGSKQLKKKAVTSSKLASNSVIGSKVKKDTLTGAQINESTLGKVPSAAKADSATKATSATTATSATNAINATNATNATNVSKLGGKTAADLTDRCVTGTVFAFGECLELVDHPGGQVTFSQARQNCSDAGGRLPSWFELDAIRQRGDIQWAAGTGNNQYEWTSSPYKLDTSNEIVAIDRTGNKFNGGPATTYHYRCILVPTNR
jgi:hypothetical protein